MCTIVGHCARIYLTEMLWELCSVVLVEELPNRNCFGIHSVILLCVMVVRYLSISEKHWVCITKDNYDAHTYVQDQFCRPCRHTISWKLFFSFCGFDSNIWNLLHKNGFFLYKESSLNLVVFMVLMVSTVNMHHIADLISMSGTMYGVTNLLKYCDCVSQLQNRK